MTQKLAILAKIGHFSVIGDTKMSKYPLIPTYLCMRKIKLEAEGPTIKGNIDYLLPIY